MHCLLYKYSRYPDIIVIPDIGWYATAEGRHMSRKGEHGWDNNAITMKVSSYVNTVWLQIFIV